MEDLNSEINMNYGQQTVCALTLDNDDFMCQLDLAYISS
jgi:hypothetical protein